MVSQTISLFRFMLLGILGRRLAVLIAVILLAAMLSGGFVDELAIINSDAIVAAFVADFMRYGFALLVVLMVAAAISEDFEFRQFERLLSMPLVRWQYIAAQTLVIAFLCLMLAVLAFLLILFYSDPATAFYWATALWMELFLLGMLSMLASLSLEKIPQAVFFSFALYCLAKLSDLISLIVSHSVQYSDGSTTSRVIEWIFSAVLYLLPGSHSFAQNDVFFGDLDWLSMLGAQSIPVFIYSVFILLVCLFDFYRKEFNL